MCSGGQKQGGGGLWREGDVRLRRYKDHCCGDSGGVRGNKASKRALKNETFPLFQQPENSPSDSLPDSSSSGNEYRALRRKYLLLEKESFGLERELGEVEDKVKTLEDEKLALLDELVVLEGLIDP
ncbi:hypothetical protein LOK49_LG04G01409 [Camellia lanceoleosa]|uniref:Uncharacterized protein n=1 Tax=Camellia lanceoleosa TaxID=1840588 RepID=A0ACC0I505_9ERIC|nr:hypothetical protein LOK49_LG04G01409 [Camellia lanceoleosa]